MTQITLVDSITRHLKTLIFLRHSRSLSLRKISLALLKEIKLETGCLKSKLMTQSVKICQPAGASIVGLKNMSAPLAAKAVAHSGSLVSLRVFRSLRPTLSPARFATKELSESIGTTTFKPRCTVPGARACRPNTDLLSDHAHLRPIVVV